MEVERAREFTALSLGFLCCTESPHAQILRRKYVSGREKPTTGRKTQRNDSERRVVGWGESGQCSCYSPLLLTSAALRWHLSSLIMKIDASGVKAGRNLWMNFSSVMASL